MMTERRLGGGSWEPSPSSSTPPPKGQCTDRDGAPGRPYRILKTYARSFDEGTTERVVGDLCPYANDAARRSRLPTISTKRATLIGDGNLVLVAGKPCRVAPTLWRLFTVLYWHRSDVIDNDRLRDELYREMEQPMAAKVVKENVRRLRKLLAGSRYEIVNHPSLGYELIIADVPAVGATAHAQIGRRN
jgi:DNA-binding response OmpR family regulator